MRRLLIAPVLLALLVGCGTETNGGNGGGNGNKPDPPFTKVGVRGNCPGFMAVGIPLTVNFRVTNKGEEDWPFTFMATDDMDSFVVNDVTLDGERADNLDPPGYEAWRFAGLDAGETGKLRLGLTPREAGNTDLQLSIWGDERGASGIPEGDSLYGCEDLAIQP